MPYKVVSGFAVIWLALLLGAGCGLIPNLSKESMSNADKAVLYMQMGVRYLEMDMLDVAKEKLQTAIKLDSGNPDIYNAMGSFYERIRDYKTAEDYYEAAVAKSQNNYNIQSNYGRFLCVRGEYKKAVSLLQEALDNPMNTRQWFTLTNMGVCYVKQNDLPHGEEYLRQALQLQPDFSYALLEMQKISYENQQYMSARAFLERYLSVASHTSGTLWIAYQTERALGNEQGAQEYGQQLLTMFPASKEAQQIKNLLSR